MGYIRFNLKMVTDEQGNTVLAKVNRMESDLPPHATLQPNIVFNALSFNSRVKMWLELDRGILDRDILGDL